METLINKNQIQIIHVLKSKLNMSDDDYRTMLSDNYKQRSSTRLTFDQASNLIQGLKRLAGDPVDSRFTRTCPLPEPGRCVVVDSRYPRTDAQQCASPKYHSHSLPPDRPGMATGKQIGMLLGIWSEVSVLPAKDHLSAFDKFLINRFGIGGLRMLSKEMVGPVRHALIAMKNKPSRTRTDAQQCVSPSLSLSKEQQCQ